MTFSSSSTRQLSYIPEATPNVTPVSGNAVQLRMTDPMQKAAVTATKSMEIASHRMSTGQTLTDLNIDGGFNFELSGKEYDPFFESVLGNSFSHYGTLGLGASFAAATTSSTVTAAVAPTGSSAFTGLALGSWFKLVPPIAAAQALKDHLADKWYKVHSSTAPSSTVITLDPSTPIVGVALISSTAGFLLTQSTVSNGNVGKYFSMEVAMSDIGQFLPFRGMRADTMDVKLAVGSIVTGSFGMKGLGHDGMVSATTLPGSPVASQSLDVMNSVTDVGIIYENGTNLLSAGSFIKSFEIKVNNNLRTQKALAVYGSAGLGIGELDVSGTMEVYLQDATYYQKWLRNTTTNLAIGVADALGNGYLIELDKVNFTGGGVNGSGRNVDVMLSLPFTAFYNAATSRGIRMTRGIAA